MNTITILPETAFGDVCLAVRDGELIASAVGRDPAIWIESVRLRHPDFSTHQPAPDCPITQQVTQYFAGTRTSFEIPISWDVFTPFQADVLRLVSLIPYGETRAYGEIAKALGNPKASRAVGRANATNPIPIILPCHRVIGKKGKMRGYNAPHGIAVKEWLLKFEGAIPRNQLILA